MSPKPLLSMRSTDAPASATFARVTARAAPGAISGKLSTGSGGPAIGHGTKPGQEPSLLRARVAHVLLQRRHARRLELRPGRAVVGVRDAERRLRARREIPRPDVVDV